MTHFLKCDGCCQSLSPNLLTVINHPLGLGQVAELHYCNSCIAMLSRPRLSGLLAQLEQEHTP